MLGKSNMFSLYTKKWVVGGLHGVVRTFLVSLTDLRDWKSKKGAPLLNFRMNFTHMEIDACWYSYCEMPMPLSICSRWKTVGLGLGQQKKFLVLRLPILCSDQRWGSQTCVFVQDCASADSAVFPTCAILVWLIQAISIRQGLLCGVLAKSSSVGPSASCI